MSRKASEFGHVPQILRKFLEIMGKYRILDETLWGLEGSSCTCNDYTKAFDTMDCFILLEKLRKYGGQDDAKTYQNYILERQRFNVD